MLIRRCLYTLATLLLLAAGAVSGQDQEGNPPTEFESYWMVFLERGDNPPKLDADASAELQRQHLAHLGKVWRDGYALVAGPFEAPDDEPLRGITLYRGDLEYDKVIELASSDPAVKAGRLKVRAMKWWTAADLIRFTPPPSDE